MRTVIKIVIGLPIGFGIMWLGEWSYLAIALGTSLIGLVLLIEGYQYQLERAVEKARKGWQSKRHRRIKIE